MFLLIDKPKGLTSHDVIDEVRKIISGGSPSLKLRRTKVGHAGTLDPNATGLLIIGVGRESTKKLGKIAKDTKKEYVAEIFLGEERDTDDVEGVVISKAKGFLKPSEKEVGRIVRSFIGKQNQTPPQHSAIKIKGKKAYELARSGKNVKLQPRKVVIHSIKLLSYKHPTLKIKCEVSSGTYIRSLARDIGRKIGCGAYLKNLKRTRIGKYILDDAIGLENLAKNLTIDH